MTIGDIQPCPRCNKVARYTRHIGDDSIEHLKCDECAYCWTEIHGLPQAQTVKQRRWQKMHDFFLLPKHGDDPFVPMHMGGDPGDPDTGLASYFGLIIIGIILALLGVVDITAGP